MRKVAGTLRVPSATWQAHCMCREQDGGSHGTRSVPATLPDVPTCDCTACAEATAHGVCLLLCRPDFLRPHAESSRHTPCAVRHVAGTLHVSRARRGKPRHTECACYFARRANVRLHGLC